MINHLSLASAPVPTGGCKRELQGRRIVLISYSSLSGYGGLRAQTGFDRGSVISLLRLSLAGQSLLIFSFLGVPARSLLQPLVGPGAEAEDRWFIIVICTLLLLPQSRKIWTKNRRWSQNYVWFSCRIQHDVVDLCFWKKHPIFFHFHNKTEIRKKS